MGMEESLYLQNLLRVNKKVLPKTFVPLKFLLPPLQAFLGSGIQENREKEKNQFHILPLALRFRSLISFSLSQK
jgi:hypothetical protein